MRRDPASGDVILSRKPLDKPHNWDSFFRALDGAEIPKEFLGPEQRDHGQHDRDVFASQRPPNWDAFKAAVENLEVPDDFLSERELDRGAPLDRDPFAGWDE